MSDIAVSFEDIKELFRESDRKLEKSMEESRREFDRKLAESRKAAEQDAERRMKAAELEAEQRQKEFEQWKKDIERETEKYHREAASVSRKLGILVEHMVVPNIVEKFNELGYTFTRTSRNIKIEDRTKNRLTEVDFWLENGDFAMAIEVKTDLKISDVQEHAERMEILRQEGDKRNDHRRLIGAVAGAIVHQNVKEYAIKNGFFVLEQTGDTIRLEPAAADFKPREW